MTVDSKRPSYRERLSVLGSLIDDEIQHLVKREVEQALCVQGSNRLEEIKTVTPESPTHSEIEEALLLLQARSDQNLILEHFNSHPSLVQSYEVFRAADPSTRGFILSRLSDSSMKEMFRDMCRAGDGEGVTALAAEWNARLVDKTLPDDEPSGIQMIRSGSLKGVEALLDLGLDLSVESMAGNNVLQEAILQNNDRMIELVLSNVSQDRLGIILTHKNKEGLNALEMPTSDPVRQSLQSHWLIVLSMEGNAFYKSGAFSQAVDRYTQALTLCESIPSEARVENLVKLEYNCGRALFRQSRFSECISHCTRCTELDPTYLNAYSQIAQARIELLDFAGAKKDFETLISLLSSQPKGGDARQVNELRLKVLELEQELKRDHYTILGIERFASDEQQIKSAYRQLARKFHPDKVMGETEDVRVRSRNQFARIQTAYEILTSPSKEEYDMTLRIQMGADSVRQSLLMRRRSSCSPPETPTSPSLVIRQMRMRQFLGSEEAKMSRSFDVLFRN